jgi:AraC family transcriptional regulator, positive regulator of tynA and feaB
MERRDGTRQDVRGRIESVDVASIQILKVIATTTAVTIPQTLASLEQPLIQVILATSGSTQCVHARSKVMLSPMQWCIFEGGQIDISAIGAHAETVALLIPANDIDAAIELTGITARPLPGSAGYGRLLSHTAYVLFEEAKRIPKQRANEGAKALCRWVALALHEATEDQTPSLSPYQNLRQRARHYVDMHLRESALSVALVAKSLNTTERRLRRAFAGADESLPDYILRRRLERACADLIDPRLLDRLIAEIAYAWGFNSAEHFSRAFRRWFGFSPSSVRRNIHEPQKSIEE